jgi:hypothetical protein
LQDPQDVVCAARNARHRRRCASAIRALPSTVLGPVDSPPWNRHRLFPGTALMMHGAPALIVAQHLGRNLRFNEQQPTVQQAALEHPATPMPFSTGSLRACTSAQAPQLRRPASCASEYRLTPGRFVLLPKNLVTGAAKARIVVARPSTARGASFCLVTCEVPHRLARGHGASSGILAARWGATS